MTESAAMSEELAQRIDDALSGLVDAFLPPIPGEDQEIDEERRDNAFDIARNVIDRYALRSKLPSHSRDKTG